jgi:hypothetical protein
MFDVTEFSAATNHTYNASPFWAACMQSRTRLMTKKIAILAILSIFLLGLTAVAADSNFGVGKTRNVTFSNATKVGDTVLPAGEYKVVHLMEGDTHIMLFKTMNNKEMARVKCTMVKLDKKAGQTFSELKTVDNQSVLTGLVFAGDTYRHSF